MSSLDDLSALREVRYGVGCLELVFFQNECYLFSRGGREILGILTSLPSLSVLSLWSTGLFLRWQDRVARGQGTQKRVIEKSLEELGL